MNKRAYRLIFDRRRNMRVATAEHTTGAGKPAGGSTHAVAAAVGVLLASLAPSGAVLAQSGRAPVVFASKLAAPAHPLPVPYGQASGRNDKAFVANPALAPKVSWTTSADGKSATFNQGTVERVVLNWDSFDIGAGHKVHFAQDKDPNKYVSALNKIWSANPSVILGSLTADREVILLNANGVYFGRGAVVDTGKFVATSLNIADSVFEKGLRNVRDGSAVFSTAGDGYLPTVLDGAVTVEAGAEIRTAAGGDVLLIAPRVVNQGRIDTPKGQAVLAAGDKVYLMSSSDPAQRGLIVAVDPIYTSRTQVNPETGETTTAQVVDTSLGVAENAAQGSFKTVNGQVVPDSTADGTAGLVNRINEMRADSGTVNLVGLTVRQNGVARATTAVKGANGVILLQGQASTVQLDQVGAAARGLKIEAGSQVRVAEQLGTVTLGGGSHTEIAPATDDTATQLAAEVFNPSLLRVEGKAIHLQGDAKVNAPSGQVLLLAADNATNSALFNSNGASAQADGSRIVVDPGVSIDVAGLRGVALDGSRNQGDTRLFRIELADAPVQRGGPLYRGAVQFDLREAANITVGNVTGATNVVGRSARELSTTGGTLRIEGEGAVVVGVGSSLDVSGGSVHYDEAQIRTSLLSRNGRIVSFDQANPDLSYDALLAQTQRRTVPAYDEGKSGGLLSVVGRTGFFGADIDASVVQGTYQRSSGAATPAAASFGRLTGLEQALGFIRLDNSSGDAPGSSLFANALEAPLSDLPTGFTLSLPALQASGLGKLTLRADEVIQTSAGDLNLGAGGALDISARTIGLSGRFSAAGGRISLRTSNVTDGDAANLGNIVLGAGAVLSTAGLWTNDAADHDSVPAAVQTRAGDISLSAARSIVAGNGSRIDVSGGAWVAADGKATLGSAGKLSLLAGTGVADGTLALGGSLAGFDFSSGGALTLGVPQLTMGGTGSTGFTLAPEFFSAYGFGDITVQSLGDVRLRSGTLLNPQLRNWQLTHTAQQQASGDMHSGVAAAVVLDEALVDRQPVSLSLLATAAPGAAAEQTGASVVVERGAGITLEAGGSLLLQAGRDIVVGATGPADAGRAVLQAAGGEITLRTTGKRGASAAENLGEDPVGFVAEQAIWLGKDASLSVAGTAEIRDRRASALYATQWGGSADAVQRVGSVLGGGSLTLDAARGYVVAEAGSHLDLGGFAAPLDLAGLASPTLVAKPAGRLTLRTPEGFVLDGVISAQAPVGSDGRALADGGRLEVDLGSGGVSTLTLSNRPYPDNGSHLREVSIGSEPGVLARLNTTLGYGDDLNAALGNGRGELSKTLLSTAGFESLTVRAGDRISFSGAVDVNMPLGVEFDTPALVGAPDANVLVRGSRVGLGNPSYTRNGNALPADTGATPDLSPDHGTRLTVEADVIDLVGNLGLKGFSTTALHANATAFSEIRLAGLRSGTSLLGSLSFAGNLDLMAGQVYASSLSRFDMNGLGTWEGETQTSQVTVTSTSPTSAPSLPLSAFGDLRIAATDIVQAGRLVQPFGAISLTASNTLTLAAGSLTSVSGAGLTVPFGTTVNLSQWLVSGVSSELTALPLDKRVSIDAGHLIAQAGATLSAAGGGELQASEFFPGVGGTTDYLSTAGLYAVLPGYQSAYAPRSEDSSTVADSLTGAQIEITMAGSGLAPGRYTLLPARYALLAGSQAKGAFIVKLASDQGSSVLNAALPQDDGSTVVTGFITQAGSSAVGQPGQRFVVEPAAVFNAKSEVRLTLLSDLLQSRVSSLGVAPVPVSRDGGAVQIRQRDEQTALLAAGVDLNAPAGALGGTLDVAAPQIALVSQLDDTPVGALGVAVDTLKGSAAGSVLLGGLRAAAATGSNGLRATAVDSAGTRQVSVATTLQAGVQIEELLLSASEQVNVQPGSSIVAGTSGSLGAHELRFSGDGAVLAVTANEGLSLQRSNVVLQGGNLTVGQNSRLQGTGVQLDATGQLTVDGSATLSTRQFAIGARHIVVGDGAASATAGSTVLNGSLLDSLLAVDSLQLRSFSSIDFAGRQDFAARSSETGTATRVLSGLVLDAPTLRGVDRVNADGQVIEAAATDLAARSVSLRNTAAKLNVATGLSEAIQPAATDAGTGTLRIDALPPLRYGSTGGLTIAGGRQQLAFASAGLHSSGDIVADGAGALTGQGDLLLSAARLTAGSGATQEITTAGALSIDREARARSLNERVGQGAQLRLAGTTITQAGTIDLPSGTLTLDAAGSSADAAALTLQQGSLTRTAGFAVQAQEGWQVFGDAGQVTLRAGLGRVDLLGQVDVSAAQQGSAGTVRVSATGNGGELRLSPTPLDLGSAATGSLLAVRGSNGTDQGGRLLVDTGRLDVDAQGDNSLRRLAGLATQGGFDREVDIRLRAGTVAIDAGLAAQRLAVTADQGSINVGAVTLNADALQGGELQLQAKQGLTLADGAQLLARSTRAGANGGDVLLSAMEGQLRLGPGATVDATGVEPGTGRIVLRAARSSDGLSVNVDALNTSALRAAEVDIEAVKTYRTVTVGSVTRDITAIGNGNSSLAGPTSNRTGTLGQTTVRNDSAGFMANAESVLGALGVSDDERERVHLRAGVEVQASGNLSINADWALHNERPGNDAGMLTLRAAGNLAINNSLSDGFTTATTAGALGDNARSWSMRLVAGADLGGASLMSTRDLSAGSTETGNLSIAAGKMVRTGAGSIALAAGRDIVFAGSGGNAPGQVYVAGRKTTDQAEVLGTLFAQQTVPPTFSERGGNLSLDARRNITAPNAGQLINNWLWRSGLIDPLDVSQYSADSQLAWWSEFGKFQQTAASFGGGNVRVSAGGRITNLGVMAPTAAWADSTRVADAELIVRNGGDIDVSAGGDISDGQFLLGRGVGRVRAGGSLLSSTPGSGRANAFALMDGSWDVTSRSNLSVGAVFNPTIVPVSTADDRINTSGFYLTYGADSSFKASSLSGDLSLTGLGTGFANTYKLASPANASRLFQLLPPSFHLAALGGTLSVASSASAILVPSSHGQLQAYADGDMSLGSNAVLGLADDADALPRFGNPVQTEQIRPLTDAIGAIATLQQFDANGLRVLADEQTHGDIRANDHEPVRLATGGSLTVGLNGGLNLSKPAHISAGEDISNLILLGQHHRASDVTTVQAGRNILHTDRGGYTLAGEGLLQVTAGRGVDLGASLGVTSTGNATNATLAAGGASLKVAAATAGTVNVGVFDAAYLQPADGGGSSRWQSHRAALQRFVEGALNVSNLGYDDARKLFTELPASVQAEFAKQTLHTEFGMTYLGGMAPSAAALTEQLRSRFTTYRDSLLAAGKAALASGRGLTLPGNEVLTGSALSEYLSNLSALSFDSVDVSAAVTQRASSLASYAALWREAVAADQGSAASALDALGLSQPNDPRYLRYQAALNNYSGALFERVRDEVVSREVASTGAAASNFGLKTLPARMAFYDQGFQALELAGMGNFAATDYWPAPAASLTLGGNLNMTQSSVITRRGGDITLFNGGGAINVGLKEASRASTAVTGVITLGGGDITGIARDDFQVNNQRVFVVGEGNMNLWSSSGDIDSGRGQNTAVAAPALTARRSADGVVFEVPATTTGSGLGILNDANGRRSGTIGLYPAFGEIVALDAFIRAPSVVLGSSIKGADNLQAASVGGAVAVVSAPALSVSAPSSATSDSRQVDAAAGAAGAEARQRNALLTVDLLGLGPIEGDECSEEQRRAGRCPEPGASQPAKQPKDRPCSAADQAAGRCK